MTFFGQTISAGVKGASLQCEEGELVHLSGAYLRQANGDATSAYILQVEHEGNFYTTSRLTKQAPCVSLDLFVTSGTAVRLASETDGKVNDKTTCDITGYIEPMDMEDDESDEEMAQPESECEDDEVSNETNAAVQRVMEQLIKPAKKTEETTSASGSEEEDSDEDEEDKSGSDESGSESESELADKIKAMIEANKDEADSSDEEEEKNSEEESDSDSDADSDSNSDDAEEIEVQKVEEPKAKKPEAKKPEAKKPEAKKPEPKKAEPKRAEAPKAEVSKKRKADGPAENEPAAKKGSPEAEFEKAIIAHLKENNGVSKISLIGAKCKRPAEVKAKLGAFLRERTAVFNVTGDSVALKK